MSAPKDLSADQQATWERAFGDMKKKPTPTHEAYVHKEVCKYLRSIDHNMRFISNLAGESFGKGQAMNVRDLQSHNGAPDLMIFARRAVWSGLAIELKAENVSVWKKDGTLLKNEHVQEQAKYLEALREEGWRAEFCSGIVAAKKVIDDYFKIIT